MGHVALYARISDDRTGEALGVQLRQGPDIARMAAELFPEHATVVYTDNDTTASRGHGGVRANRPAFRHLTEAIGRGEVHAVVAWDMDRLFRDPLDQEQFFILCERQGMVHVSTLVDKVNITTGDGIMVARIKAAVAAEETRKTGQRILRKQRELRERGRWGGGKRPFGYQVSYDAPGGLVLDDREAAAICAGAVALVSGLGPYRLADRWNEAGIERVDGTTWTGIHIRFLYTSARLAGLIEHGTKQRIKTGVYNIIGAATYPAVLPEAQWRGVIAALTHSHHTRRSVSDPTAGYWLAGLITCHECGGAMKAHPNYSRDKTRLRRYACLSDRGGCGLVGIDATGLEGLVYKAIVSRLAHPMLIDPADRTIDATPLYAEIDKVTAKLLELESTYFMGDMPASTYRDLKSRLTTKLKAVNVQITPSASPALNTPETFTAAWPVMDVTQRRQVAQTMFRWLTVRTATPGAKFDPERLAWEWAR